MGNKQAKYTFGGINQDISKSKHMPRYYFEAQNIRLLSTDTQASGGVANEKGNESIISIPNITITEATNTITYGTSSLTYTNNTEITTQIAAGDLSTTSTDQVIIGHTTTRNSIILFTTDEEMDCIWELTGVLDGSYTLTLLYLRNFDFSINSPIQAIFNYENTNIQKIYWVDGVNQVRTLNIKNDQLDDSTPLIDTPLTSFNFVGTVDFSQPQVTNIVGGGTHTSGMIQYAYNLYRLNASQTKISPISELVPLDKGTNLGGGAVNEQVGASPVVQIDDIDTNFTHIKIYAIKYTSYNEIPSVDLIEERELNGDTSVVVYDDGSTIESLSLDEFLFLGSDPLVVKHIESKDNILFLSNVKDKAFDIPDIVDCRAYSFRSSSSSTFVWDDPQQLGDGSPDYVTNRLIVSSSYTVPYESDAVNLEYDTRKYKYNSSTLGGTGKYLSYEIVQKTSGQLDDDVENYRFLKDREIYRIAIQFYNRLGQVSPPKWIADFKAPSGNLEGDYNTLKVTLGAEFYTWLNTATFDTEDDKPVGYKIVRADRQLADKSILCQGLLSGMMVNSPRSSEGASFYTTAQKRTDSDTKPKLPNFLTRTFEEIQPLKGNEHLERMQTAGGGTTNWDTEIQHDSSERKADTYQYTTMYQMYSPEIQFASVPLNSSTKFNVIGGADNTFNSWWGREIRVSSEVVKVEGQTTGKITPKVTGIGTETNLVGDADNLMDRGLISETNGSDPNKNVEFNQWYREFSTFKPAGNLNDYFIYGTPELTGRGQGVTTYNNNSKYTYANTLEGFLSDGEDNFDDDGPTDRAIISLNSLGNKCVTFVSDDGSQADGNSYSRTSMENLYSSASIGDTSVVLLSEFVRPDSDIFFGNIYGGNSYEDKTRTSYIEIGDYNDIATTFVQIDNAGDTYVQNYRFLRIGRADTEIFQIGINQISEIVDVVLETTVDLKNRNDVSTSDWQTNFMPKEENYHEYNRVYSQQPTLVQNKSVIFNFQRVREYDARIQATKSKIPNETIDSWTDVLVAEVIDLNGKYGPINNIVSYRDNIYAFQDEAIASVLINPRVQVQSADGISLELGTGGVLYDFDYLTTKSGSINKWGIIPTRRGIYYYDALNKALGRVPDMIDNFLSDVKGLHTYFNNNYDYTSLQADNPYLRTGVVLGYDNFNNDVYITLLQGNSSFTRCFNESIGEFIDLKVYQPSTYIYKGEKFFTIPAAGSSIYEQYAGEYNNFFGSYSPSYVTLMLNPESDYDCIFNTIEFTSELYLNDVDQPANTLTHIQAYSEYQDSGRIQLVNGRGSNLRRKFREWKANIPREDRNRIRNPWIFLKLELDNESNYKFILHDVIVNYTV